MLQAFCKKQVYTNYEAQITQNYEIFKEHTQVGKSKLEKLLLNGPLFIKLQTDSAFTDNSLGTKHTVTIKTVFMNSAQTLNAGGVFKNFRNIYEKL